MLVVNANYGAVVWVALEKLQKAPMTIELEATMLCDLCWTQFERSSKFLANPRKNDFIHLHCLPKSIDEAVVAVEGGTSALVSTAIDSNGTTRNTSACCDMCGMFPRLTEPN